jgi:hypothetical protein
MQPIAPVPVNGRALTTLIHSDPSIGSFLFLFVYLLFMRRSFHLTMVLIFCFLFFFFRFRQVMSLYFTVAKFGAPSPSPKELKCLRY